ncbi:MAG TPA: hypothetical protein VIL84_12220 [Devosiaceae bacterium]
MREPSVSPEIMPHIITSVGMLVLNWSFVENTLDMWTAIAYRDVGGDEIEKEIPKMFSRKVKYLRKCFRRLAPLAPHRKACLHFVERAKAISDIRHNIVHGTLSDYDPETEMITFSILELNPDKTQHIAGKAKIVGRDLIGFANELLAMASTGPVLTQSILDSLESQDH